MFYFVIVCFRSKSPAIVQDSEVAENEDGIGDGELEGSDSEMSPSPAKKKKDNSEEAYFQEPDVAAVYKCENKWCRDYTKVFKYSSLKERHDR